MPQENRLSQTLQDADREIHHSVPQHTPEVYRLFHVEHDGSEKVAGSFATLAAAAAYAEVLRRLAIPSEDVLVIEDRNGGRIRVPTEPLE